MTIWPYLVLTAKHARAPNLIAFFESVDKLTSTLLLSFADLKQVEQ
jgi:hypothetical protein